MNYCEELDRQWNEIKAQDGAAKDNGELVGRFIQESCADSYAYYRIVKVKNQTVIVEHLDYCDGWRLPMIESMNCKIPLKYAIENIEHRDRIDQLFSSRK
jgi:hypothetical protein